MAKLYPKPVRRLTLKRIKKVNMEVSVSRTESGGRTAKGRSIKYIPGKAFVACARFKTGGWTQVRTGFEPPKLHDACAWGKNPRQAIARALGAAKKRIEARSGAFAGMRRRK